MKISTFAIEAAKNAREASEKPFRWSAHHVKELIFFYLKGVDLDGSSKIQLTFGEPEENELVYSKILNASNYYIVDFDKKAYDKLSEKEREMYVLKESIIALKAIAELNQRVDVVGFLSEVEKKIIDSDFYLLVHVKKLDKIHKIKNIKYKVNRVINREVGEGWQCIVDVNGEVRKLWMHKIPHFLDMTEVFKRSDCSSQKYSIYDRLGKERFFVTHEGV
ncbi:hypothetical protein E8K88_14830 [Lampropedia aestuarii]|uniref:Uncharacterized protein n=1 Tax=Lampropedia aestuarii TaxID=2562762 RepID=A0A4S5BL34_9BURK|nr:hypothetical protein [Lampropedia aestuarii]THJ31585.1 hypothetical protein E8K88_14830 [Lampropedia aestuarii]